MWQEDIPGKCGNGSTNGAGAAISPDVCWPENLSTKAVDNPVRKDPAPQTVCESLQFDQNLIIMN